MNTSVKDTSDFVKSLAKGLKVINVFGEVEGPLTLSEVAVRTGMTRAAARRFLLTLTELGYTRIEGRNFFLTPKILSLSGNYLASDALPDVARPFLKELTQKVHESSSLSVLEGNEIVYVARILTQRIMSVNIQIGTRFPAWCTSMGRAQMAFVARDVQERIIDASELKQFTAKTIATRQGLLDELDKIHEQGYALVDQQLEEGIISIAVPVFSRNQQVIAAANVAGHSSHTNPEKMVNEVLPALKEAVTGIQFAYQQ